MPPVADDPVELARQVGVANRSWYQFLTIAGTIGVVTSAVFGGAVGLAVQLATGSLTASAAAGVAAGLAALAAHMARQWAVWARVASSHASSQTYHR